MIERRVAAVLLAATLVAGCAAPTATGGAGTAAQHEIDLAGGDLPADPDAVYARTEGLLGANVTPPESVRVVDDAADLPESQRDLPRFWRLLGIERGDVPEETASTSPNGLTTALGGVVVYPGADPTVAGTQRLLAHEFVHYVSFARDHVTAVREEVPATTDGSFVVRATVEGVAVRTTDAYVERYLPNASSNTARYEALAERLDGGTATRYTNLAYRAGAAYVADRTGAPADVDRVFDQPPNTSEQVLHGVPPGVEPPAALDVTVGDVGPWVRTGRDTMGEAFTRVALEAGIPRDRAASAARGWGNDTLLTFHRESDDDASYAWVTRWDDAANATAFADALGDSLGAQGQRSDDSYRLDGATATIRQPSPRVVVVALGDDSFARGLTVTADERGAVRVGGDDMVLTRADAERANAEQAVRTRAAGRGP